MLYMIGVCHMSHEMKSITLYIKYIPLFRILYLSLELAELWHFKARAILYTILHFHGQVIE